MSIQLVFSFLLLYWFYEQRKAGNTDPMLFVSSTTWYESLNIQLKFGIDGISMSMILLTSIVTLAGVFVSWQVDYLTKEFFISLILLASGVFGFFISLDLFTLKGGAALETFEPHFTFHGFRYVQVTGYPGELTAGKIRGIVAERGTLGKEEKHAASACSRYSAGFGPSFEPSRIGGSPASIVNATSREPSSWPAP